MVERDEERRIEMDSSERDGDRLREMGRDRETERENGGKKIGERKLREEKGGEKSGGRGRGR